MNSLDDFIISNPRPLPVIILADVSGSMGGKTGKIEALNSAIAEMISSLAEEDDTRAQIQVAVIIFGKVVDDGNGKKDGAKILIPLQPAAEIKWHNMTADGKTPMGAAFDLAVDLIEKIAEIRPLPYHSNLLLVSDGAPTDDWEKPFNRLISSKRASKAFRFAMGIGDDADINMLKKYLGDSETEVYKASNPRQIRQFFKFMSMSISVRNRSVNPNTFTVVNASDINNIEI